LNSALLLLIAFVVFLLVLLAFAFLDSKKSLKASSEANSTEDFGRNHVTYFPQVRQSIAAEDFVYLSTRGSGNLARRVRKERRKIALVYLTFLRSDFLKLWKLARVIASMSPRVGISQEAARLRLGLTFSLRYELIRMKFILGFSPIPEIGSLSEVVSRLAIRMENAMQDLGERAALAGKFPSSLDGRG
jgi:hypothetical protein